MKCTCNGCRRTIWTVFKENSFKYCFHCHVGINYRFCLIYHFFFEKSSNIIVLLILWVCLPFFFFCGRMVYLFKDLWNRLGLFHFFPRNSIFIRMNRRYCRLYYTTSTSTDFVVIVVLFMNRIMNSIWKMQQFNFLFEEKKWEATNR